MTPPPITVLHVDDDPEVADLAATFLERADAAFTVLTERRATDALERLRQEDIDCIVSDYQMPEMDGLDLLAEVRSTHPAVPFILFTGHGSEEIASKAISAGADEYIQKTVGLDQYTVLANRVRNLVEKARVQYELTVKERAMAAAPTGITLADPSQPETPLVYANEGFQELTGYDLDEVLGRNCSFLQGPDTDPDTVATIRDALATERSVSVEILNYRKDGTPFWNRLDISPVYDRNGDLIRYVGFQRDVTDEKRAMRELRDLVDRISDAFFALDADWRFTYVNHQAETLLQRSHDELLGACLWDSFPESQNSQICAKFREAMQTQEALSFTAYYGPLENEFEIRLYPSETGLSVYFKDTSEYSDSARTVGVS